MTFEEMAQIHSASFVTPRPWSATEIEKLLAAPNTHVFTDNNAFALLSLAGPEAEILTIAVHPNFRRKRIATDLLETMRSFAEMAEVEDIFLEVAIHNLSAIKLYEQAGYTRQAIRKDYYSGPNGEHVSAIVMSHTI